MIYFFSTIKSFKSRPETEYNFLLCVYVGGGEGRVYVCGGWGCYVKHCGGIEWEEGWGLQQVNNRVDTIRSDLEGKRGQEHEESWILLYTYVCT